MKIERKITLASKKLEKEIDDAYANGYKPSLISMHPQCDSKERHVIHMRCARCQELDFVFSDSAKNWQCPSCNLRKG